jgi:hypothetical protein
MSFVEEAYLTIASQYDAWQLCHDLEKQAGQLAAPPFTGDMLQYADTFGRLSVGVLQGLPPADLAAQENQVRARGRWGRDGPMRPARPAFLSAMSQANVQLFVIVVASPDSAAGVGWVGCAGDLLDGVLRPPHQRGPRVLDGQHRGQCDAGGCPGAVPEEARQLSLGG